MAAPESGYASNTISLDDVEEIENIWIPMSDGCRIAARVWMPRSARTEPVPAIVECIPYRKRDFMRSRDEPIHRYFAAKGYVSVRVDIRGSGDSDGILHDEYAQQELDDMQEVIAWIADQLWCSGKVGMMGISWGGFNALQVAALKPPALKAIITLCSTDDRYADDAHYMGGCLLNENMQWGSILTLYSAYPPDPHIVGDRWRDMWRERLDALEPFPVVWMGHPWRDDYWRHGSVCEDYGAIDCAVYAIGGWADGYSNAVPRLLANLDCPKKGLVGPWAHVFPHDAMPGPSIGFLQEAVRWWSHWLMDIDTGIMDEPEYRVWMQESVPPLPTYEERPGRWVAEDCWPSARIRPMKRYLNVGHLSTRPSAESEVSFCSPQTTGLRAGEWCAFGAEGEMPRDQRPDDGGSVVFDSDPLSSRVEILGAPTVELDIKSDKPVAILAVRLSDVAPDGAATRVSYGLLNLTHRRGHAKPAALRPGRWYRVTVRLNDIAHAFPAGNRIRIALSSSYWPIAWPAPEAAVLTVRTGTGSMTLPVRPPRQSDAALPPFCEPATAPGTQHKKLRRLPMRRTIEIDLASNEVQFVLSGDGGEFGGASLARIEEIDLDLGYTISKRFRIAENDPLSARVEFTQQMVMRRSDWNIRIESRTAMTSTGVLFQFSGDVIAYEGDEIFAQRDWNQSVPRRLV